MVPFGIAIEKKVKPVPPRGIGAKWKLSQEGLKYGPPIAAYALKFAVDQNLSLLQVFGYSLSGTGKRHTSNIARIFKALDKGIKTVSRLSEHIECATSTTGKFLQALKKQGLITFESVGTMRGRVKYNWIKGKYPEDVTTLFYHDTGQHQVAKVLSDIGTATCYKIADILHINTPAVSMALDRLFRHGFITKTGWTDKTMLSNAKLL